MKHDKTSGFNSTKSRRIKKPIVICLASILLLIAVMLYGWGPAIFQRGNPLPYWIACMSINEQKPYVEVGDNSGIYISKRGECPELFKYIEDTRNVAFEEQAGSGYLFTNGTDTLAVSSEIYWGRFTVWTVPIT